MKFMEVEMKSFRKITAIVIALAIIVNSVPAKASNIVVKSKIVVTATITFDINKTTGKATCGTTVTGKLGTSSISGGMLLYKDYEDESKKKLLKVWHIGTLSAHLADTEYYTCTSRGDYTLVVNVTAYCNGKPEKLEINRKCKF